VGSPVLLTFNGYGTKSEDLLQNFAIGFYTQKIIIQLPTLAKFSNNLTPKLTRMMKNASAN
jgi:hypothetical protein